MLRIGRRGSGDRSEEAKALVGAILALTAVGATIMSLSQWLDGGVPLLAVPSVVVVVAMLLRRERPAIWASLAAWLLIAPMADGIGILAPLMMVVLCLGLAVGPDALAGWLARDWSGARDGDRAGSTGWIEDDPRVR